MEEGFLASAWCFSQRDFYLKAGETSTAENYNQLGNMWLEKENKESKSE